MARRQETARGSMPLKELLISKESTAMASFGVRDLDTMMRFAPRRYVVPAPLRSLHEVSQGEEVSAVVSVVSLRDRAMRSRHGFILEVTVSDGDDEIVLTFFLTKQHQLQWHRGRLAVGARIIVHGTVGFDGYRQALQITHPAYEPVEDTDEGRAWAQRPRPVYPLRQNIAQATMRSATEKGLEFAGSLSRPVPDEVIARRAVAPLEEAVRLVHTPLTVE
ncbi:MAG: ATP-dependent DNA helicase RecG, partial [Brachybacterium sp.]|nr:ATP-dependent DNA helicase RecG [Brachybacterium sp.]